MKLTKRQKIILLFLVILFLISMSLIIKIYIDSTPYSSIDTFEESDSKRIDTFEESDSRKLTLSKAIPTKFVVYFKKL